MRTATVYNFLLEATLMASIAILLMIPIRLFLRKQLGSRALTFGWLLVAIRLLCPLALPNPAINSIRSSFAPDAAVRPIAGQLKVRFSDVVDGAYRWASQTLGQESGLTENLNHLVDNLYNGMLSIHLMEIYLIGLVLIVAWFGFSNLRFRRRLRADRIEPISGKLMEEYQALCAKRGVKPIPVWYVDPLPSACLVGVFKPYIALPLTASPQEAIQVLQHELCHYRGRDHWWGLLRLASCAIHWFNPLVWLAAQMSRTDIELACDDRVVAQMDSEGRKAYANVLILAAAKRDLPGVSVLSTGMSMTGRKLKNRISAILGARPFNRGLIVSFVLLSSMALVGAFATAEYAPRLPILAAENAAIQQREIATSASFDADVEDAIAYAKEIWANPYVQGDSKELVWKMSIVRDHIEVSGYRQNGEAVFHTAFLKNGQLIYLCNEDSGDRDAIGVENGRYEQNREWMADMEKQVVEALKALSPTLDVDPASISEGDESEAGDSRFLHFYDTRTVSTGITQWGIRIQVEPVTRVTYFIDHNHFTSDDADRLEPGNG